MQVDELKNEVKLFKIKAEDSLKILEEEKHAQKEFLVKEYNEVANKLNLIEQNYENIAKTKLKEIRLELDIFLKDNFERLKQNVAKFDIANNQEVKKLASQIEQTNEKHLNELEKKYNNLWDKIDKTMSITVSSFNKDKNTWDNQLIKFKLEISKLVKSHIDKVEKELKKVEIQSDKTEKLKKETIKEMQLEAKNEIKIFDNKLDEIKSKVYNVIEELEDQKKKETIYLEDKVNELIDNFNNLTIQNEAYINLTSTKLKEFVLEKTEELNKIFSEKFASNLLSNNEFLMRISTEVKEAKRNLSEDIETKLVNSKSQFEAEFQSNLLNFNTEIKKKEEEFFNKIKSIHNEKEAFMIEMNSFKDEINILTKEYISKLDLELQNIKSSEVNFNSEKIAFFTHIDELVKAKKVELEDYVNSLEEKIYDILKSQKQIFDKNENSFKETFNEKVTTLKDYTKKRLDDIETKFVDKNLKIVTDKINSQLNFLTLFEEKMISKEEEIKSHLEILDQTRGLLHEEFDGELNDLNSKVENRLTKLEQKLNKRFIDYDTTISSFKSIVIDEVEDLIKEVNHLISDKIHEINLTYDKVKEVLPILDKNINEFNGAKKLIDTEIRNIRNELNDQRLEFETVSHLKLGGMNALVQNMTEYENQLIDLIVSLKNKGISNDNIEHALIAKGHPRIYVSIILNNFDKIYLK